MSMPTQSPDFMIRQVGSFTNIIAVSDRAAIAPDALFPGQTRLVMGPKKRGYRPLPRAASTIIVALSSAGYVLSFQ